MQLPVDSFSSWRQALRRNNPRETNNPNLIGERVGLAELEGPMECFIRRSILQDHLDRTLPKPQMTMV